MDVSLRVKVIRLLHHSATQAPTEFYFVFVIAFGVIILPIDRRPGTFSVLDAISLHLSPA